MLKQLMLCVLIPEQKIMIRTYSELKRLLTFEERFNYLKLSRSVGSQTFGFDRYINQSFYSSREWKAVRREVIIRDNACDLGVEGRELFNKVYIHHMNPITIEDVEKGSDFLFDLEYLICTSHVTHNAIHFGNEESLINVLKERRKGDTTLWKPVS